MIWLLLSDSWFATFADIAGIPGAASDDDDVAPRPSDSIDAWPGLIGQSGATTRNEIPLSISMYGGPRTRPHPGWRIESGALIVGRLKLIIGNVGPGVHFYPTYPNSTTRPNASDPGCPNQGPFGPGPTGCLYDIIADPGERSDLAAIEKDALQNMTAKLYAMVPSLYQSDLVADNNGTYDCTGCLRKARGAYATSTHTNAWFGPWL
eukprot:SAG31_NODE_1870_length_7027_cov_6.614319_3_plen_207_part_00